MIIKNCKFHPILIDSRCLRKGILLQLTRKDGKTITTEISPLPGFSEETLEDAIQQLQLLKRRLLTTWWTKQALHYLDNLGLYPSVHFGVESALCSLLESEINPMPCQKYALLIGSPDEIIKRAEEAYQEGFRRAKVKLGHFTSEIAHSIIHKLGDKFRLCLDFNRKWTIEESSFFCSQYPTDYFEYVEEPACNPNDLIHFSYPYALDETLRDCKNLTPFLKTKYLKAFIIKPTLIYPISHLLNLGPKIILTSSFESSIGIAQIERLIYRLGLCETHHGLDTLRYFERNYESVPDCLLETALS